MFACHQRDAAEVAGAVLTEECPRCQNDPTLKDACGTCDGLGIADPVDPRTLPERWAKFPGEQPEWARTCGAVLRAWGLIQRYGVDGWLRLEAPGGQPSREPDAMFVDALGVLNAAYARLEHLERIEEGKRQRKK